MTSRRSILAGLGAAAVGFSLSEGAQAAGKTLRFLNWDTYIGETTLSDFQRETGVNVDMYLFGSNDELWELVHSGRSGKYDVIVPSNDNLSRMIASGLVQKLDHRFLPNFANIDEAFRDPPYDPGSTYSVPYAFLVQAVGFRRSAMKDGRTPDSWRWLFESDDYSGRIALVADPLPLFMTAAKYLGYDVDGLTPALIAQIEAMLIRQKPHISALHHDDGQDRLLSGEVDVVMEYSGDIAQVQRQDNDLDFVVPREGALVMVDTWAIPANAPNPVAAHAFLNYMLSIQGGKGIFDLIQYPTPNAALRSAMPAEYRDSPILFPALDNCRYGARPDAGTIAMIEAAFARFVAA